MKKHLLFNQLFGTEGSPNQTGETLTRENRIGLMSYLRRTLMLLFAVLVMSIGEMWGANIFSAVANSSSDLSVSSKSQVQFTAAQATVSGGKMYYTVTGSSNRNILDDSYGPSGNKKKTFCFSGNDQYYSVKLNNTINEGDTIYVEIFADKSLWFTASSVASRPSSAPATATSTGTSGAWTAVKYVIAKNSDLDGVDTLHIWRNSGNTYFSSIWIAQKAASCDAAPTAPSAFAKTSVTNTTAIFDITDAANAASYDIYCSESSTDPTSGTTPTATGITTKTPTVTGLTAGTTYYAWVRAVCDGSHKSNWVALDPTTFTTLAAPTASFSNSTYAIGGSALVLSSLWSSNSAGSVTYSVEDAAGTGASVSTASFSATRAGKAKVKAVQAANGSYDAITKYAYITVGSNVVGKHTVTYDLEVNVDKSRIPVTDSVRSTSLYLTTAEGDTLKGTGVTYSGGQKSGLTGKISAPASYDGNKYVYVQFSIASGYQLTLDSAWCVVQAVGKGKNQNGKLVISDSNSHSFTGSEISCPGTDAGTQTHVVVKGDGSTAFTGTVTLKIYVYGSDATYRLGEKINIHGSVAAAAGATYKLGGSWNDFSEHTMEVSDGVASYSVDLAADTRYEFYLKDNGTTYKSNGTIMAPGGWVFTTGENNAYIHTGPAGTYTFSMNTSTHAVSVTYPDVTHPSDHYVYFKNSDVWGTVHAYLRDDADNKKAAAWPGSPTATTTICGQIYHYAALNGMNGTYTKIQFNDGYAGYGHETSVLSVSGSAAKYNANRDANWYDPAISITFDKNGGTGSMEKIVGLCSGDNKTLPSNTFTRTGWEFDGWNTDKYGGGTPYEDGETIEGITANITLYAQWKKTVYMESDLSWWYDKNGDDVAWYAIYYWDSGASSNNSWVAMELAGCETTVYKATLPGNGYDKMIIVRKSSDKTLSWTGVHNQTVNIDYPTTNPKYTITSQISGGDDNGKVTGSWGTYSIPTFTISYAGGTAAESGSKSDETKTCEVAFTLPDEAVFSRTGYTQTGWTTSEGAAQTHALGGSYTDNAAQTFYPVWTANPHTLTWVLDGGTVTTAGTQAAVDATGSPSGTVNYGETVTAPGVTKTGYNFSAWSPTVVSPMPDADKTYTATWTAKTTAITLEAGEGGTDGSATATYGTSTITDYVSATRTGYTLGDYYQDGGKHNILTKEGELNSGDKGSILDDGLWVYDGATITLYAQWTAIEYTIAYNLAGGSVASPNPTSYTIESSAITLNNPTKTGYTFAGWTGTGLAEATTAVTIAAGSTGNRSYTATWTAIVPSSVSLNKTSTTITVGGTETLTATISPAVVADNTITWTTSDGSIATVSSAGVVTAVAAGTATITATTHNGKSSTCTVTVTAAASTTYYLVTSTAQLNTTDTYVIMDDGKAAMMGVYGENAMTAITSGFTAAADKSTVTVTSSDVNTLTLQAESSAWNIVGKDDKKLTTNSTVGANLYGNTPKANSDTKDDFVFEFGSGKVTIKRSTEANYHIYYTSGTGFNQSTTATNIRLYTSNSTPVDVTAPTLSSSTPANGATGVGVSGNIELTFSENVTINDASKFTLTGGAGTLNTASASASGAVVTIPYTGLAYNTTYTLATAAEAVKDGSNNKNAAFDITFTTLSATGSCNELNYVWQTGSSYTPKGVSNTYAEADTAKIDNAAEATTHITISGTNYAQKTGSKGSLNLAKAKDNHFLLTAASGYVIDSVYFYGKLEDGACRMSTDGSAWTTTLGDGSSTGEKVYAIGVGTQYFGLKNKNIDSPKGIWIRTMMVKVCPAGTTYTVNYDANGHGSAPDAETDITPGSTISAPDEPTADCWTFNGWYKDRACTNVWNFAEGEVNSNITLYAKWTSNKARVKGLDYGETDYTVTSGTGDAITVTPVSASGVTYKWYSNTSDDVTGWSEIPSAETASYSPSIASVGTTYYWAVLVHDCGNDTTSSVRINVAASKTDPTIAWGNVQLSGVNTTPTYGGGGYTLTGTINAGAVATPTLTTDMISADGGIVITNKSVNDAGKTFSLTFNVTAAFDTTQAKITNIHFSLPSNATYNDSVFSTNLSFDKCSGGSYSTDVYVVGYTNATGTSTSSSANKALKVAKSWISTASPSFTDKTSADGFSIAATNANCYWKQSNQTIISTTTGATMRMYKVGLKSCTIEWTTSSLSFSKVRIIGRNESADPSTVTVSNGTEEKTFTFAGGKQYELQVQEVSMEFVYGAKKGVRIKGDGAKEISAIIELVPTGSDGAGTGTATALQWKSGKAPSNISGWDGEKIVKAQSDDDFTCVAEQTSATNSVGAITYASDNTDVATVNETTGEVDIVAGAAGGEATITATMARSGCFMKSILSYTISVPELACAIEPGTLSASATSKCKTADVTLTLSDYTTTGTTISWYKSGTAEPLTDGDTYDIGGATLTTAQEGTYYAKVTLTEASCSLSSNNVTITNKGGAASVSKLVNQWYIKKGRVTPDIALWRLGEGSSYVANSVKADGVALTDQLGGCTVIARDSTIYLSGGDPTGISAVGDVSLTVQVQDECGNTTTSDAITIHKQVATDKHELAFVTTGTNYAKKEFTEDAWTAGIKAANSTGLALYQVLKDTFKIQATNIYASDDEKKLREYYSQYDLICITDYPNTGTKGKNKKSYVDAIGSLIDIRPILTMEAYVSGLDNWRNKGAVGTRTTPSKRQYNMYLQCKDHEMFEGVTMQQIGYGDDALFKVNMVDSTQSRYAQLDAVGKDSHATDTAALQGFTTGDMDLLAIGLIDNGSGTNLQVGAERQNVMTARMMILGVNSYAMERLSEDGMRVIVNALQYLTKKRAEDISDCSTYFTNAGGDNRWENPANWRSGTLPYSNQEARILQPVVVSDTRKIASVKIVADGTFQNAEARGSLTIAPTGALIVNSMIQSATGPDVFSGYPTEISHLTIQTDDLHQGALIFDNSNGETQATVNLYSKAYNDGSYKFQYFASPFMDLSSWAFDAYIYTHNESLDVEWTELRYGEDVSAFQGLAITADGDARNYTIDGTLASTNPHTFNLTYTSGKANNKKGSNVIGNSWSAPIQITRIDDSDFSSPSNFEGIIYIYNAGRDVLVDGKVHASDGNSEPGQWQSIPVALAKDESWEHKRQIPAFQAFQMKVNAATDFTLDYNKHVRQEASVGVNNYNEPLHAPSRSMRAEDVKVLRLCVEDAQVGKSYIYLCEGDEFTEERDRGWEAKQTVGSGKYGKLYAIDQARDYMMSIARPSLEGTPVGFICGQSTEYTISFNETDGTYYLNDLEKQQSTLIQEGESYTFTTTKGNHPNRFIISATPFEAPSVATGMTNLDAAAPKVQKIIYNDKLYIIRGGKVYSADGQVVK